MHRPTLAKHCDLGGSNLATLQFGTFTETLERSVAYGSKCLGHATVSTTANIYAYAFATDEVIAVEAWETKIGVDLRH